LLAVVQDGANKAGKEGVMNWVILAFVLILYVGVPTVLVIALIAVTRWANLSRREKEAYYKSETLRKIAGSQGAGSSSVSEFLQGDEKIAARHRRESYKLGGLITVSVGLGMMIFIKAVDHADAKPVYLVGVIPLLIGAALLGYVYFLAPRD
jgi:hypothetical protein